MVSGVHEKGTIPKMPMPHAPESQSLDRNAVEETQTDETKSVENIDSRAGIPVFPTSSGLEESSSGPPSPHLSVPESEGTETQSLWTTFLQLLTQGMFRRAPMKEMEVGQPVITTISEVRQGKVQMTTESPIAINIVTAQSHQPLVMKNENSRHEQQKQIEVFRRLEPEMITGDKEVPAVTNVKGVVTDYSDFNSESQDMTTVEGAIRDYPDFDIESQDKKTKEEDIIDYPDTSSESQEKKINEGGITEDYNDFDTESHDKKTEEGDYTHYPDFDIESPQDKKIEEGDITNYPDFDTGSQEKKLKDTDIPTGEYFPGSTNIEFPNMNPLFTTASTPVRQKRPGGRWPVIRVYLNKKKLHKKFFNIPQVAPQMEEADRQPSMFRDNRLGRKRHRMNKGLTLMQIFIHKNGIGHSPFQQPSAFHPPMSLYHPRRPYSWRIPEVIPQFPTFRNNFRMPCLRDLFSRREGGGFNLGMFSSPRSSPLSIQNVWQIRSHNQPKLKPNVEPEQPITVEIPLSKRVGEPNFACILPLEDGYCPGRFPQLKWYFNHNTQKCELFFYGGCGGNLNRYDSKAECFATCMGELHLTEHSNYLLGHLYQKLNCV